MIDRLDKYSQQLYLNLLVATDYPEQEPEHKLARWYDLLWLLFFPFGFLVFIDNIKRRG